MNTKLIATLSATAAVAGALLSSAPAQAYSFSTGGISFDQDTQVNFKFIQSNGANKSSLGIYTVNGNTIGAKVADLFSEQDRSDNYAALGNAASKANGYQGTAANLTGASEVVFTFLAGQVYTLGLFNQGWQSTWTRYSTTDLMLADGTYANALGSSKTGSNPLGTKYQKAVFGASGSKVVDGQAFAGVNGFQSANPFFSGGIAIGFEDSSAAGDADFNDFTVTAEAVPEPLTMGGLALGGAWLAAARRRRNKQTA